MSSITRVSKQQNIPAAMLAPVISDKWQDDEYSLTKFATQIEGHSYQDNKTWSTAMYVLREGEQNESGGGVIHEEVKAMRAYIPDDFVFDGESGSLLINQHYSHSLDQMYAEIQKAYKDHVKRTNAIIGTPAGTIRTSSAA